MANFLNIYKKSKKDRHTCTWISVGSPLDLLGPEAAAGGRQQLMVRDTWVIHGWWPRWFKPQWNIWRFPARLEDPQWFVIKKAIELDEKWGYPYFRKPSWWKHIDQNQGFSCFHHGLTSNHGVFGHDDGIVTSSWPSWILFNMSLASLGVRFSLPDLNLLRCCQRTQVHLTSSQQVGSFWGKIGDQMFHIHHFYSSLFILIV